MKYRLSFRCIALSLVFLMVFSTVPVSGADISRNTSIGAVNAVGAVDLRGVRINSEGTLFSGDRVTVGAGSYAKVALGVGPKIEIGAGSDVTVSRDGENVNIDMRSGNVAFKGNGTSTIRVHVGAYEITAKGDAAGNVAFAGTDVFGVRVINGAAGVRNSQTKQSYTVQKGSERLISLKTGVSTEPLAKLASALPSAVPALPRQQQQGLSKAGWIAVLGTVAGAATAIIILATGDDESDDDAATRLAQVKAVTNLTALQSTAAATSTLATQVNALNTTSQTAINASSVPSKAALLTQSTAVKALADSALAKVAVAQPKIDVLKATITNQAGGPTQAQLNEINQLINDVNSARTDANNSLTAETTLVAQASAAGVTGLPAVTLTPVPPPLIASASAPF
jgi:acid phosphatase family membrane protein YuiD